MCLKMSCWLPFNPIPNKLPSKKKGAPPKRSHRATQTPRPIEPPLAGASAGLHQRAHVLQPGLHQRQPASRERELESQRDTARPQKGTASVWFLGRNLCPVKSIPTLNHQKGKQQTYLLRQMEDKSSLPVDNPCWAGQWDP